MKEYLAEKSQIVECALKRFVPDSRNFPVSLHEAVNYSLYAGGKRIRPVLMLAVCDMLGLDYAPILPAACAMECIHTYSLIHDDLPSMDNDDFRRGIPTCHKRFSEAHAILAGDALLTHAFYIAARHTPVQFADKIPVIIEELSLSAGLNGMIGGQVVDLESEGKDVDIPTLQYIHTHKTGALLCSSVKIPALIYGQSEIAEQLAKFGAYLGLLFQIKDDILDVIGKQEDTGKPAGSDSRNKKATYVSVYGMADSVKMLEEFKEKTLMSLGGFENTDSLRGIVEYIAERGK